MYESKIFIYCRNICTQSFRRRQIRPGRTTVCERAGHSTGIESSARSGTNTIPRDGLKIFDVPVVQRIEYKLAELVIEVRFLSGTPRRKLQAVLVRLVEFIPTQEGLGD